MEGESTRLRQAILIIEDHKKVAESLRRQLVGEGYQVQVETSGDEGCAQACAGNYDLVILDLMLPGMDGFAVLSQLRQQRVETPVLILTARDDLDDRLRGLNEGGDDYLVKPFAMPELLARVRNLLRRAGPRERHRLRFAGIELDLISRVALKNGSAIDLAPREFELLALLMSHAGSVVTREMLGREVWMQLERATPLGNVIDVHIGRLRRKIDGDTDRPLIRTVRGLGFTIAREP